MKSHPFESETREHRGVTIIVSFFRDDYPDAPWEACDGHGPVSDWTTRDKKPGELVLCSDRNSRRFYDYAEAIREAKRDGWDAEPYKTGTKGQQAHRAVMADFEYLRAWCNDEWSYCYRTVEIIGYDYPECSLGGIESTCITEETGEAFTMAVDWLESELANAGDAACRDVPTIA